MTYEEVELKTPNALERYYTAQQYFVVQYGTDRSTPQEPMIRPLKPLARQTVPWHSIPFGN